MMKAVASDTLRETPHYRAEVFRTGLARLGYEVGQPPKADPSPRDVLLVWNRHGLNQAYAERYERAGARVIVAENGFIGVDDLGNQLYAVALNHHLGAGEWPVGPEDRWSRLNIRLKPWRGAGREIIVLPQRGIGPPGVAMPSGWIEDVVRRLKAVTDRPIRVRLHPGKSRTDPWDDLQDAWAAVTWASGAGIKAIVHGVPVFHELPQWIGYPSAKFGVSQIEGPFLGDRLPMLERLAFAQWTLAEIASGEPFRRLLTE
jgi:hypothetical protein